MPTPPFTGVAVALATLFRDDGSLDPDATATHAERLVDEGVTAVVVAGSTGEAPALDMEERLAVLRAVRTRLPGDVPVVAGTGDVTTYGAVRHTAEAVAAGADAVLALSPLRVADPRPYYEAVRGAAGGVPVLAYHFPAMSPPGIAVDLLNDLDVDGCKDSSGDGERLLIESARFRGWLYVGAAPLLLQASGLGCTGAILALANLEPRRCVAAFGGDSEAQKDLLEGHLRISTGFPHGLKRAMAERYGTSPVTRMG